MTNFVGNLGINLYQKSKKDYLTIHLFCLGCLILSNDDWANNKVTLFFKSDESVVYIKLQNCLGYNHTVVNIIF